MFQTVHPSWHFYSYLIGVIVGIIVSSWWTWIFCTHWLWLVISALLLIIAIKRPLRLCILIAFIAGCLLGNYRTSPELTSQQIFASLIGQTVTLRATIATDPDLDQGQTTVQLTRLALQAPSASEEAWLNFSGTIYAKLSTRIELKRSDQLTLSGQLSTGFGTFVASLYRPALLAVECPDPGDVFVQIKSSFATHVQDYIAAPAVDLGLGYLVGLKSGLPDQLSETLRTVGMTHVVVASGAHLGILVGAARKIFAKISKFASTFGASLLILFFALLVGFTPSMTRAALVASLSLLTGYVGRRFSPLRLIIFVAAFTLLLHPTYFLNLGWQLSFASFFGLLIIGPHLQRLFYGGKHPPWLASMLLTSLSTSLICAPILIYNFGSLSLLSFVANLFILPTLPYAMLLIFLTGISSFCLPFLATFFGHIATLLLNLHIWLVEFLSEKKMFIIELPAQDFRIFGLYLFILLPFCYPKIAKLVIHLAKKDKLCYNERHEDYIRS